MAADAPDPASALAAIPPGVTALHRPPRSELFLPVLRALLGPLQGLHAIEAGAGAPLLLSKTLAAEGLLVTAVDPELAGVQAVDGLTLHARDVLDDALALPPADVTLSSMLFGAPLRQQARRALWPRYLAGDRPAEEDVAKEQAGLEARFVRRFAEWTRPGGWSVHWSLESLFALDDAGWRAYCFDQVHRHGAWLLARRGLDAVK